MMCVYFEDVKRFSSEPPMAAYRFSECTVQMYRRSTDFLVNVYRILHKCVSFFNGCFIVFANDFVMAD